MYITKAKYRIVPTKAVVGVDLHMKALSKHIWGSYKSISNQSTLLQIKIDSFYFYEINSSQILVDLKFQKNII